MLQGCWNMVVRMAETARNNQYCLTTYPRTFFYRRSLGTEQLSEEMEERKLFGYVQCDTEVPKNLRSKFDSFPPKFKNTLVSKGDIGDLMKNYVEEEKLLSQPRKMLKSSCTLQNRHFLLLCCCFI